MQIEIPKIKLKFYLIAPILFLLWMLFFDPNNVISQYRSYKEVREEEKKVEFYKENIEKLREKSRHMSEDINELERYAREQFYMKKPSEDVFIMPQTKE